MSVTQESLYGRVLDISSLEQMRLDRYPEEFGERARRSLEASAEVFRPLELAFGSDAKADVPDTMEITAETVWSTQKYGTAPSASDLLRRPAVLDAMGIHRQLVFPVIGLLTMQYLLGDNAAAAEATAEQLDAGWEAIDAYNEWAADITTRCLDRVRVVAVLALAAKPGVTPDALVEESQRLISSGVRALVIPSGRPPADLSPADPALDPFYATLAEANVALLLRGGLWTRYRATEVWGDVPRGGAFPFLDPTFITHVHQAEENFLTAMVIGGVFERHPTLRFGVIEAGASWVGPLAELMDFWAANDGRRPPGFRPPYKASLKPSEFLARNVRVTPLADAGDKGDRYEPVEVYFQRYPAIKNCYCYGSDFPLTEGGQWSLRRFYERVAPLGDDIVEKFFCENGKLVLP